MRICVIGDGNSPHVRERVRAFARLGHEVRFITPVEAGVDGVEVLSPPGRRSGTLGEARFLLGYYRLIRDCPADLVHVHYAASLGAWLALMARPDVPLAVSTMGGDIMDEEQMVLPRTARWMTYQVLKRADLVTAKTDHMMGRLSEIGIPTERAVKNPWGVDLERFRPRPERNAAMAEALGIEARHRVIMSPRLLRPFYNADIVFRALPAVLEREPNARLVVLEHGADEVFRTGLHRLVDELGVAGAVIWAGEVPHEQMPSVYSFADAVISLTPSDGFPQTVLEAMACGKPCIVSRLSRYEEIVKDGESAVFTDLRADAVAAALLSVLTDTGTAERLRANGLEAVRRIGDIMDNAKRLQEACFQLTAPAAGDGRKKVMGALWPRVGSAGILFGMVARNMLLRIGSGGRNRSQGSS